MAEIFGKLNELPLANENNFIPNSDKRIVFGPTNGLWDDYVMRSFTLHPGAGVEGKPHKHPWNHWMIVLSGNGKFELNGEAHPMEGGMWVCIPKRAMHRFYNDGTEDLVFLCIVPPEGDINPTKQAGC